MAITGKDGYRYLLHSSKSQNRISDMENITGAQIKAARERKHMTQQELADELGVSMRTIGSWERGESVTRNRYGAIVDLLGIDEETQREYGRKAMARRLGQLAKQRREELGLALRPFAAQAQIGSDRTIKDFEFGDRTVSALTARRFEKALGWKAGVIESFMREAESRRAATVTMEELDAFDTEAAETGLDGVLHALPTAALLQEVIRRLGVLEAGQGGASHVAPFDSQDLYGMAANTDPSHLERLAEEDGE